MCFQSNRCSYVGLEKLVSGSSISPPPSLRETAALKLLSHMLREPLFNKLRTQQTLGYIVSSGMGTDFVSNSPNGGKEGEGGNIYSCSKVDSVSITVVSKVRRSARV